MDRISGLSDELLIKILLLLPTKVAISTCKLSKRWECVWKFLPKLDFACASRCESFRCFLNLNLPLHRAPVIESFRLDIVFPSGRRKPEEIKMWLVIAVSRSLRELDISYHAYPRKEDILPSSLYACKSLVVLKLNGEIDLGVLPRRMVCLPSLKTLQLRHVSGVDGESLGQLLSICPVLENLLVDFCTGGINMENVIVSVLSLQSLTLVLHCQCEIDRLEIDTPSLKYLKLEDPNDDNESCMIMIKNMPELEEAYVDVRYSDIKSLMGSITSVKRLTICSQAMYGDGFVFNQLEDLKLCDCTECSSTLLPRLLIDSPNLRALNLFQMIDHDDCNMVIWNQPSHVPACFTSTLQTFSWSGYLGRQEEREVAVYVLKWASRLVTARILPDANFVRKLEMLKELSVSSRASTACQLFFD